MKRLIYRLSSLGDVILSQAALNVPSEAETHWVVSAEYADLLCGNPKIHKVITFDRKSQGLREWIELNRVLSRESFDEVLDLHSTLRTRLARFVFWWSCFFGGRPFPKWAKISKSRLRRLAYVVFKGLLPRIFLPHSLRSEFLRVATRTSSRRNFKKTSHSVQSLIHLAGGVNTQKNQIRFGVMPGSAWPGKKWPTPAFLELLMTLKKERPTWTPVVFGNPDEDAVRELCESLKRNFLVFDSETGKKPYAELARALSQVNFLVSNDTGLAHLAEGLGKPVVVLYGPTTPEFGFAPALPGSRTVGRDLWCRPCGKDGSSCFRIGNDRHACMKGLSPDRVRGVVLEVGDHSESEARAGI